MKKNLKIWLSLFVLTSPMLLQAQPYTFDLGGTTNSITYSVKKGQTFTLTISDFLPKGSYTTNQSRQIFLAPPLPVPAGSTNTLINGIVVDCNAEAAKLDAATSESAFAALLKGELTQCPDVYNKYLTATTQTFTIAGISNEMVTMTITNTVSKQVWTIIFQPELNGQMVTLYGFTYIPYWFTKSHSYFAQAVAGSTTSYQVTRGYREGPADYAPTISFHYIKQSSNDVSQSFTAGLGVGFNTNNAGVTPVLLVGYSLLVYQCIGLNVGLAGHLVSNLKSQYQESQVITTNLNATDLTEKSLGFNPFISVVFRFGSSPFSVKPIASPTPTVTSAGNTSSLKP
jgi:hypothetical protein